MWYKLWQFGFYSCNSSAWPNLNVKTLVSETTISNHTITIGLKSQINFINWSCHKWKILVNWEDLYFPFTLFESFFLTFKFLFLRLLSSPIKSKAMHPNSSKNQDHRHLIFFFSSSPHSPFTLIQVCLGYLQVLYE